MLLPLLAALLLTSGCSLTKTVPEGRRLYTGSEVDIQHPDTVSVKLLEPELEALFAPRPNRKLFGIPFRLHLYNFFNTNKEKGLWASLQRSVGEAPVLFQEDLPSTVAQLMERQAFNLGYYHAEVVPRIDTSRRKRAQVTYEVEVAPPYTIQRYERAIDHEELARVMENLPPGDQIRAGAQYALSDLKRERQRIAGWLQEQGYFFFDPNYLKFVADSLVAGRQVALKLVLKDSAPAADLQRCTVERVVVYPDFRMAGAQPSQAIKVDEVYFQYNQMPMRPKPLAAAILFRPGDPYSRKLHQRTRERLFSLSLFQFANIRFQRSEQADSLLLMEVYLSPRLPNTVEGSIGISHKSTRFLGPEANLTFTNRNLFGGSERLLVSASGNFNFPLGGANVSRYYEEIEARARLTRPGLLFPWLPRALRRRFVEAGTSVELRFARERARVPLLSDSTDVASAIEILEGNGFPETAANLKTDSTYAPFLGVNEIELTFGYQWKLDQTSRHEFDPLHFRFQIGTFENPELELLLAAAALITQTYESFFSLQRMFIYQPQYRFTFDSRLEEVRRHNYFFQGRLAYAGNEVLPRREEIASFDDLESRFLQVETDWRYYLMSRKRNTLAARLVANLAIPFGNEIILPFFDFYSIGGPNSVRAFGTREVGPGTVDQTKQNLGFLAGLGDIKLEGSLEYRWRLGSYFELAAFVEAGNVWLFQPRDEEASEADFKISDFYRELAAGTGLGLRVNLSSLIIRLDFGIPLTKPWLPEGERWVGNDIDLFSGAWRSDNLQWNLAFGYPF